MSKEAKLFFIIGAQRSGTTFLYKTLERHSEICMAQPVFPEPKIFFCEDSTLLNKNRFLKEHFKHYNGEKYLGEKSTSYYENISAIKRIVKFDFNAKFILLVRNPIERALSNYFFTLSHGLETRSLEEVFIQHKPEPILKKKTSVSPFNYLQRGYYLELVNSLETIIDSDNFLIVQYEKMIRTTHEINKLLNFLGLHYQRGIYKKSIYNNSNRPSSNITVIREKLRDHFNLKNIDFASKYDIDISLWQ